MEAEKTFQALKKLLQFLLEGDYLDLIAFILICINILETLNDKCIDCLEEQNALSIQNQLL